jgi:hypothetical protein
VAQGAVQGMNFTWSGQSCSSTSRLLVHESIADEVVTRIAEIVEARHIASPLDPSSEQGTMVTRAHHDNVKARGNGSLSIPLFGRVPENAALEAAFGEQAAGSVPVVVVHGEAGIGKTSLISRFADAAAARGSTVLWGGCFTDSGSPYGPWVQAINGCLRGLSPERVVEVVGPDAAVLAAVAPAIGAVLGELGPAPELSVLEGQRRCLDAVARFFERLEKPMLVLDDMQWADASALDLLVHVARVVPDVLIVVIFRGGKRHLQDPLAIRLARVGRVRRVTYLLLEGLSRDDAGALLERAASRKLEPGLVFLKPPAWPLGQPSLVVMR